MSLVSRRRRRPVSTEPAAVEPAAPTHRAGTIAGWLLTALAALLVFGILTLPVEISKVSPAAFLRLPVEALAAVALLLILPARARRWAARLLGVLVGLVAIVKILDLGFLAVLARPFDPALDWILFDDGIGFLTDSIGRVGAIAVVVVAVLLAVGLPTLTTLATGRLARLFARRRRATAGALAALTAVWVTCAVLGTQLVPGEPIADRNVSALAYDRVQLVRAGIADTAAFAAEAGVDAYRDTPADQLLAGLRGKDVIVAFVESYGRSALENPQIAPQVTPTLDADAAKLGAAGFAAKSGFLTSSTVGSGSGLAHATLLSGLWIDSNRRWRELTSSNRLTLSSAFERGGWRTVGVMPGNTRAWPEGDFYGFQKIWDDRDLGYQGPPFHWATMPDQYVMDAFQRDEYGQPNRAPLFAQINLVSSHAPWAPIPHMIDPEDVGDGSVFGPQATAGPTEQQVWSDPVLVRQQFGRSIAYSVDALTSWVQLHGNDNTVVILLGDHQPLPLVTDDSPNRDVPISIVAKDPEVLQRIAGWGWQDGIKPAPQSPVWKMDQFRDNFMSAFTPHPRA